jgi:hypothetical protein
MLKRIDRAAEGRGAPAGTADAIRTLLNGEG